MHGDNHEPATAVIDWLKYNQAKNLKREGCNPLGAGLQPDDAWQVGYHISQSGNSNCKLAFHNVNVLLIHYKHTALAHCFSVGIIFYAYSGIEGIYDGSKKKAAHVQPLNIIKR